MMSDPTNLRGTRAPRTALEWMRQGYKNGADVYTLNLGADDPTDARLASWGAVAIRSAYSAALDAATAPHATGAVAQACAEATRHVEASPLAGAAHAIGNVRGPTVDGAWHDPPHDAGGGGIRKMSMRFSQLRPHSQRAHIRDWTGRHAWLPATRPATATQCDQDAWYTRVHRGFREGGGASQRKEVQTVAVNAHGAVSVVADPTNWPWLVEYELDVSGATRTDGSAERILVTLRLGHAHGDVAAHVTARYVQADGKIDKTTTTRVGTALQGDHDGTGLRELFWNTVMRYHTAPGAQAATRRAAACATTRCLNLGNTPDAEAWHALRRVMGGEVPPPSMQERTEEGLRRRAAGEAAASEAERRTRTVHTQDTTDADTRARHAQTSRHATPHVSEEAERLRAAASTLGVAIDAPADAVRRAYLIAAVRAHPDKAGGTKLAFIALQDAHERIRGATDETRHRAALEVQQAQGAATQALRRARHDAMDATQRLSEAVVMARDEASSRALSDWIPGWKRAAGHLRSANRVYMNLWLLYQKQVLKALNEQAQKIPGASYNTHAERAALWRGWGFHCVCDSGCLEHAVLPGRRRHRVFRGPSSL